MYVKRNETGSITAVSVEPVGDILEEVNNASSELEAFLPNEKSSAQDFLESSDLQMARVMEDTVILLMSKGIIQITDLPVAAQEKLLSRRNVRGQIKGIDLLLDEDEGFNI